MIGLDTNVLIRYLVRDDQHQYEKATRLLRRAVEAGEPIMVSLLTLLEMEWALRSRYALSKEDIAAAISSLLDAAELMFEDEPSVEEAMHLCFREADFSLAIQHSLLYHRATWMLFRRRETFARLFLADLPGS